MSRLTLILACCCIVPLAHGEEILRAHDRQPLTQEALLAELRQADFILLGERHDNPRHHQARGELLQSLAGSVVLEHLDQGKTLAPEGDLEAALEQAAYNRKGWRWPMQAGLFTALRGAGHAIRGGNLSRAEGRAVAIQGEAALEAGLKALLAHPLPEPALARLDAALSHGHCGQLKPERLPNMRLAQRARDAALARALLAAPRPAYLLAGNGHVRRDYGVPTVLRQAAPTLRIVSVGFIENLDEAPDGAYDYLWLTPPLPDRPDPCAGMVFPHK